MHQKDQKQDQNDIFLFILILFYGTIAIHE